MNNNDNFIHFSLTSSFPFVVYILNAEEKSRQQFVGDQQLFKFESMEIISNCGSSYCFWHHFVHFSIPIEIEASIHFVSFLNMENLSFTLKIIASIFDLFWCANIMKNYWSNSHYSCVEYVKLSN